MTYLTYRQFIAAVITAAIVITGFSAAPARAGQNDLAKALAALAGLAVLGAVIKTVRDDDKKARPQREVRRTEPVHRFGLDERNPRHGRFEHREVKPRPLPRRVHRKLLPQQCLHSVADKGRRLRVFGQRCLERHYMHVKKLPRKCERRYSFERATHRGYDARCLSGKGYKLARR